jgi:hypothetical protein
VSATISFRPDVCSGNRGRSTTSSSIWPSDELYYLQPAVIEPPSGSADPARNSNVTSMYFLNREKAYRLIQIHNALAWNWENVCRSL